MASTVLIRHSIKTRITLTMLALFAASIWCLAFYSSRMLRQDLQHLLGEQQFSMASFVATEINGEVDERLLALKEVAGKIASTMKNPDADLQIFLEDRPAFQALFNGGTFVTRMDGIATASFPRRLERRGLNYLDRDYIGTTLREGKPTVGRLVIGRALHTPVFGIGTPIRNAQGKVIGVLAGVTNLTELNFLDRLSGARYGKNGYFLIEEPNSRVILSASDKRRIMQPLPAPGTNMLIDRFLQGFEETGITVNPFGVEVLASSKRVPITNWLIVAALPTDEAFAPIRALQQRIFLATIVLTLAAGAMVWWRVGRRLSPMVAAAKMLGMLSDSNQPPQPLPIGRKDEIGQLIGGFNHLLKTLSQREQALMASEEKHRLLIENSHDIIYLLTSAGVFTFVSPAWTAHLGHLVDQVVGKPFKPFVHAEDRSRCEAWLQKTFETGEWQEGIEYRVQHLDKSWRWHSSSAVPLRNDDGIIIGIEGTACDITERKQAEEALREREERYRTFFEHGPDGIVVLDPETTRPVEFNDQACRQLGYTREEFGHLTMADIEAAETAAETSRRIQKVMVDGHDDFETLQKHKQGDLRHVHVTAQYIQTQNGSTYHCVWRDITERKQAEERQRLLQIQLQQAQKMESLGSLAGGVAHDMNNVLGAILGMASLHINALPADSRVHQAFETIMKAAERGGKMVKSLLSFARQSPTEERELDLNAILREEGSLLERTTLAKIRLEMDLALDLRPMRGDAGALAHAIMNLCINAVDAMPQNGTLTLRTRNVDNDWIEITVEDNGTGMSKEILEKAVDPFFTTKEVGKGTGLGLSMVYSTIKAHQGQMEILSEPGTGTRVMMRFPACEPLAHEPTPEPNLNPSPRALKVLVADDDELIRCTILPLLELLGHTGIAVECGEEALEQIEAGFDPDLVILDMNMPGMGGVGTLPRLRLRLPTTPVLLATGRVDQFASDLANSHPYVTLLSKPFSIEELQQCLDTIRRK